MSKQQTATNCNTTSLEEVRDYYQELNEEKRKAVDWRLAGLRYKDIANGLETTHQTIRRWFMKGGACYKAYEQERRYLEEDRKSRIKSMQKKLDEAALDSIIVVHKIIKDQTVSEKTKGELAINILKISGRILSKVTEQDDNKSDETQSGLIIIPDNKRMGPNSPDKQGAGK